MTTATKPTTARTYRLFIDGDWSDGSSGRTFERRSPASGEVVAVCPSADEQDTEAAIQAARRAFDSGRWSEAPAKERAGVLRKTADKLREEMPSLARILSLEMGKPIREATVEVALAADVFDYYAGLALDVKGQAITNYVPDAVGLVLKEPVGVVGIITPWNFPLLLCTWKLAPSLAVGCTNVLKPSTFSPCTTYELGRIVTEAGAPPGVVNVVTGPASVVGEKIAASPAVDKVAFTGSTETGRRIMQLAASNVKKISLELGGKSPNIVFADANLEAAAWGALFGIYLNAGQVCQAGSRLLVQQEVHDAFLERFMALTGTLKAGDPLDESTSLGPLVSEEQLRKVEGYVQAGRQEKAKLLKGGQRITGDGFDRGLFYEPTVFDQVDNRMKIAQEEIFGPVLSVIPFREPEEALRIANETMYGLAAAIWTNDLNRALKFVKGIKAGSVWVNSYHTAGILHMPFGGYKASGIGRELGQEGMEIFLETKSVQIKLN
jgi:acyl-CoA reductase-like NAD-dependent aldehyde dehydrogenase